ncbi:Predicted Zn-dependent peptidase [Streptomyces radiopugnans]|uniref:Predicted Zn-dependent peptidase n=1 Tax=Streptomyces radiopugnans TaxID=403935 RepID=A0A1H9INC1_9ACTN|nr:Predicted Zn-dependent peptidase [Streptomyces radiopugnans]
MTRTPRTTARPTAPVGRAVARPHHAPRPAGGPVPGPVPGRWSPSATAAGNGAGTVRKTVLPGGLRVVTESVPTVRSATFGIWARVGSRDETPTLNGATHYLEHLLFKGTGRRSALDISAEIDAVGGEMNAFTAKEFTCYYARVLDTDLPLAVDVVCDMLTGSLIRSEDVDAERNVVLEEIAMTEDDPGDCVHDLFARTMLGDTPLGRPVLGTTDTINALTRDQIARFYRRHYDPTHLVVAAAGNLDHDTVVRQVREAFERAGALGRADAEPVAPRSGSRRIRTAGRVDLLDRATEQAHVILGMPGLSRTDERRWALGVLSAALGGGMSSRLFQEVREKRGLAYSVYSYTSGFADCGLFGVYVGCRPNLVHDVLKICRDELDHVAAHGLGDEELRRAIGQVSGSTVMGLEDTGALMNHIGKGELCWGEQLSVDGMLAKIASVTPDDIRSVAREILGWRPSLSVIGPLTDRQSARLDEAVA